MIWTIEKYNWILNYISSRRSGLSRNHPKRMEVPMQTILITGTSSGYGLETARHFLNKGWNVIATMRRPDASLFRFCRKLSVGLPAA